MASVLIAFVGVFGALFAIVIRILVSMSGKIARVEQRLYNLETILGNRVKELFNKE